MDTTEVEAVAGWLRSSEGRAALRRTAERHGIGYLADDLESDVLFRAVRHDGPPLENVGAFTTTLLRRAAIDLLRGERRRFTPARSDPAGGAEASAPVDVADAAVHVDVADEIRRAIASRLGQAPTVGAACLARLAAELDHASISADAPRPVGGAGEAEAVDWATLWYAGQDACFPVPGSPDDPATRQRRKRAIDRMRRLLADAAGSIEGVTADG